MHFSKRHITLPGSLGGTDGVLILFMCSFGTRDFILFYFIYTFIYFIFGCIGSSLLRAGFL